MKFRYPVLTIQMATRDNLLMREAIAELLEEPKIEWQSSDGKVYAIVGLDELIKLSSLLKITEHREYDKLIKRFR